MEQAGRVASNADPISVLICGALAVAGAVLAFNWKGAADRFFDLTSSVTFGFVGSATPRLLRFVGGGIAILGVVGVVVEISVELG
ncbi:hypothetical protein [Streptomyces sp. SAT1]|uniref:hypothetical protein n=1 Tax=Streptomyces sp. SAT1 TaxID=1849967 RepID=UPI001331C276|nr:hypothetical protein [Streptomyces sp. SAT1]